ncbi:SpoIIE family protein phosphatase [Luteimonas sp. RD2P54]|uniref:SpoIIE family protein phosphatase n=1 Tax=Luteimonas endophytica TaxID=3042023 RepID=A0ABT6JD21_9GAMM|nr:SpoIIE family protein phosphatase [Luteimonas endophytica]MDH5824731.1 SpoIIE family protein phosphatase [Luteimonas endophytica]
MTVSLLLLIAIVTAWLVRERIIESAQLDTRASAYEAAERLEGGLRMTAVAAGALAELVATAHMDPAQLSAALQATIGATPGVSGGLLALEPEHPGDPGHARYFGADGMQRDFVADGYDYRAQAWYRRSLSARDGWWSEPYLNRTAGHVWMVTYNLALPAREDGSTRGMVSLDLPLEELVAPIESLAYLPGWQAILVAPAGTIAMSTVPGVALHQTLDGYIAGHARPDLEPAARAVRARQETHYVHQDILTGEKRHTVVKPAGDSGWTLLVGQSYALIVARLNRALSLLLAASVLLALVSTLLVRRFARKISRPVEQLAASASRLGLGEYGTPVEHVARHDEVGQLARTLESARGSIRRQLAEIEEMGAARQKLESELDIARDIQRAMLPLGRVIDCGRSHLDAQAVLEPAKAVGGDFYNFIERGDGELWFVIGDVSDKGVPAALFMARTVTILEVAAQTAASPAQVLAEGSRRLVQGNDTCMFATVLCGRIDVRTGACTLASAGHDPPVLLRAGGRAELLALDNAPPLGFEVCEQYSLWEGRLAPGDCLLAYTDGVTEAFNPDNEAYGSDRLLALVRPDYGALDHCRRLIAEVHGFASGAPQHDDIAVLAIRMTEDAAGHNAERSPAGAEQCSSD